MPKFVIERSIPGVGKMSTDQFKAIAQTSCDVLRKLGPQIQWVESFVTDDCIYNSPSEEMIREHAKMGGFPANSVQNVRRIIDPTTAD